jgi:XTP/dITP diphosphohydrolase
MRDCRETPLSATSQPLLIATTNAGKVRELRVLLADLPYQVVTPADVGLSLDVEETGDTFVENARLKARAYHDATGLMTIGEDSGLEIDALGGEPGVYSARYHGLPDGPIKNAHVLELLRQVPTSRRGCRYRCAIVLLDPGGNEHVFEGKCAGRIAYEPAGNNGFGYDPIVLIPRLGQTVAELSDETKNRISHRGRASRQLVRFLRSTARV